MKIYRLTRAHLWHQIRGVCDFSIFLPTSANFALFVVWTLCLTLSVKFDGKSIKETSFNANSSNESQGKIAQPSLMLNDVWQNYTCFVTCSPLTQKTKNKLSPVLLTCWHLSESVDGLQDTNIEVTLIHAVSGTNLTSSLRIRIFSVYLYQFSFVNAGKFCSFSVHKFALQAVRYVQMGRSRCRIES